MELTQFIARSLVDIAKGVKQANSELGPGSSGEPYYLSSGSKGEGAVSFDVAVTVTGSSKGGAGALVQIAVVSAKLGGEKLSSHEHVSRLQFQVFPRNSG